MTHRRLPCVCVEGDGGDSRPATTRGAGACRSRRNDFFCFCFCQTRKYATQLFPFSDQKNRFSTQKQNRKHQTFFSATKTPKTQISLSCAHTSCGVDTRTRNHPERNFKAWARK
uniref:(northern house mosquito) hypothetical protein n=1 Tax=Culex pipiens TaxID=7175 RepID=A0A8D8GUH2_CULPI